MTIVISFQKWAIQFRLMITTIEKKGLRERLLTACIAKQQFLIDDLTDRVNEITAADKHHQQLHPLQDFATSDEPSTEINTLKRKIQFAITELDILQIRRRSPDTTHEHVTHGAIVTTNHHTFFVSASIEKISVDGHIYIGISTYSPIYNAMAGKIKGETFVFNDLHYKIKDVF